MIGAVVAVDLLENLRRHAHEACRLPDRHASLRDPGRCRMSQRVRRDVVTETSRSAHVAEAAVDALDRLAMLLDHVPPGDAEPMPAA
jgi:hypothetical protein